MKQYIEGRGRPVEASQDLLGQDKMTGTGHRQKLRRPLQNPQQNRLNNTHFFYPQGPTAMSVVYS